MRHPSPYLQRRMRQRGITEPEIDEILADPEIEYPSESFADRKVLLGRTSKGRRLKVVVLKADPEYVITVADRDNEE
jgi:hypothetical protein